LNGTILIYGATGSTGELDRESGGRPGRTPPFWPGAISQDDGLSGLDTILPHKTVF
jgi:hypothetical protein